MDIKRFSNLQAEEVAALIKRNLLEISSQYYSPDDIASIVCHLPAANLIERAKTRSCTVIRLTGKKNNRSIIF